MLRQSPRVWLATLLGLEGALEAKEFYALLKEHAEFQLSQL